MELEFVHSLVKSADTRIVLLVMDGLGGLPMETGGKTELEAANTPNLDRLATEGICGLHEPIGPGVTPGSGPSHLALFGYDPVKYQVGRGVLGALGINFDLGKQDIAARGNFCSVDDKGIVTDRRAGRIPTEKNKELCEILRKINVSGAELFVQTEKDYRFVLVLRGDNLSGNVDDTDPQDVGKAPLDPKGLNSGAEKTAAIVKEFVDKARKALAGHHPANMVLLRGFSKLPDWPMFPETFGLRAAAIAAYPMYKGVAKLVGMDVLEAGETLDDEFKTLEQKWHDYDFFYFHVKKTDSAGEDGDFDKKVSIIEEVDKQIPRLMKLNPDVVVVTGDHSTPSLIKYHGWHPVPVLLWSKYCRSDETDHFGERACTRGGLGPRIAATELLPIALANAHRLEKFGA